MRRGGRPRPSAAQNTASSPQRGSAATAAREPVTQGAVGSASVPSSAAVSLDGPQSAAFGSASSGEYAGVETVESGIDAGLWASAMVQVRNIHTRR